LFACYLLRFKLISEYSFSYQSLENLMGDRRLKPVASLIKSAVFCQQLGDLPTWALLSLMANSFLLVSVVLLLFHNYSRSINLTARTHATTSRLVTHQSSLLLQPNLVNPAHPLVAQLGPRHQLTYQQWVNLLEQEAQAAATNPPDRLTILVGDSLSLWFPSELLLTERSWLNQGISGETSAGLLRRLDLFSETKPETLFVMIGINDLIRGVSSETLLANHRLIMQTLKEQHPQAEIVVQSILPHGAEQAVWEGRSRLLEIPNSYIRELNQQLEAIAVEEGVYYLDLHPLFTDTAGNLRPELSTDGLHLSSQGYLVWSSALQIFSQTKLDSDEQQRASIQ
jgi:lysophospholipase L1-like esterase